MHLARPQPQSTLALIVLALCEAASLSGNAERVSGAVACPAPGRRCESVRQRLGFVVRRIPGLFLFLGRRRKHPAAIPGTWRHVSYSVGAGVDHGDTRIPAQSTRVLFPAPRSLRLPAQRPWEAVAQVAESWPPTRETWTEFLVPSPSLCEDPCVGPWDASITRSTAEWGRIAFPGRASPRRHQ